MIEAAPPRWFVRRDVDGFFGLALDNLQSVELVAADGQVLQTSSAEHPDLFWALRGGGGNFGVVTSFEFRAHPVHTILGGLVLYTRDAAVDVIRHFRDFMSVRAP